LNVIVGDLVYIYLIFREFAGWEKKKKKRKKEMIQN